MTDNPGSSQGRGWRPDRRQFLEAAALGGLGLRLGTQASGAAGQGPPAGDGAVYLTDLDRCRPASALSTRLKRGTWKKKEEVAAWSAAGEPPILPTATRLRKLGAWELTLETPG